MSPVMVAGDSDDDSASTASGSGGNVYVGVHGRDNDGYQGRVNEYDASPQGARPSIGLTYWTQKDNYFLDAAGEYRGDAKDQSYGVDFQANRYFRIRAYYEDFLHRLDHDPLADYDAGKGGPVLWHTDQEPGVNYDIGNNDFKTKMEFTVPGLTWLRLRASYHTFQRHGGRQARNMSKCASCHLKSQGKTIDQRQQEVSGGVSLRFRRVSVDYDYLNRQFNERGAAPMAVWDKVRHPTKLVPVFGDRVQYGFYQGPLPYDMVPDGRKTRHSVKARVQVTKDARLSGAFIKANVTNKHTGLGAKTWGWNTRFTSPLNKKRSLYFTIQAKQLDVDADDVFVDVNEPAAVAGPHKGKTYVESYPDFGEADFTRRSTRSRNRFSIKGELAATFAKHTNLRGGYEFRHLKRDNFDIENTDVNRVYFSFRSRKRNTSSGDWSTRLRYVMENTKDPFLHEHAAMAPLIDPVPTGSAFTGLQYYKIYAAREAGLTQFPTWSHFVEPSVTWMPTPRVSATFHYRFRTQKNDDLNMSSWSRTTHMPGAELWFSPLDKLDFTVSYTFENERSDTLYGIPVYDG